MGDARRRGARQHRANLGQYLCRASGAAVQAGEEVKFAADSLLEEAVTSEPVSGAVLAVDGDRKVRVVIGAAAAGISSEAAEAQRSRLLPKIEATDDEARLQLPPQRAVAILTSSLGRYIPGTSAAFISGLEQGRRNPTIVSIYELANALGVSHIELVRPIEGQ